MRAFVSIKIKVQPTVRTVTVRRNEKDARTPHGFRYPTPVLLASGRPLSGVSVAPSAAPRGKREPERHVTTRGAAVTRHCFHTLSRGVSREEMCMFPLKVNTLSSMFQRDNVYLKHFKRNYWEIKRLKHKDIQSERGRCKHLFLKLTPPRRDWFLKGACPELG